MNESIRRPAPALDTTGPGVWQLEPSTSKITFHSRKLGLIPVNGRFREFSGELRFDGDGIAVGHVQIEAASIKTGIKKRDAHLRAEDFFHTEQHPRLTFVSDPTPIYSASRITGTLKIRDKEIPVDAAVKVEPSASTLRVTADFKVDHDAAGLGWAKPGFIRKIMDAHVELTFVPTEA